MINCAFLWRHNNGGRQLKVSAGREPVGTIEVALSHAARLLEREPTLAVEQAAEILKVAPHHAGAMHLYGLALGAAGRGEDAVAALRRAVALNPELPGAWRALADHLGAIDDVQGADAAYARHIKASTHDPRLLKPAAALCENDIPVAEALLRAHLKENPTDVAAIRMLAEVAARIGRYIDAENLLARCLELAPSFITARTQYASVLNRQNRASEALQQIEPLLAAEPDNPHYRNLKATFLVGIGEYQQSIELYRRILVEYPHQAKIWLMLGHVQKTAGRQEEAISAYRRGIQLSPGLGEAYWSLANLKTFRFAAEDMAAMRAGLTREPGTVEDRLHLHFALGKACEDRSQYETSFQHYAAGNRLRRAQFHYSAAENTSFVQRSRALYTRDFFVAREGAGCQAADPIFVVGLPRAGSTLVEQILSSHSLVEGTMELHDMISLARSLEARGQHDRATQYLDVVATLTPQQLSAIGEQYLDRTRIQRKTAAPFFIDKMPNNFRHLGLIHLLLPNAHASSMCAGILWAAASRLSSSTSRAGNTSPTTSRISGVTTADYVELMAHFDAVLPGQSAPGQLRGAWSRTPRPRFASCSSTAACRSSRSACGFTKTTRAVRTASSEQVRQPIFREGLDQWRHYEPWLQPLRQALGATLEAYPGVPTFHTGAAGRGS